MIAGALGAAARYGLDGFVSGRLDSSFPWGTFLINVSGSLVLGFLYTMLTNRIAIDSALRAGLTVGFLGSYTTFSTLTLETARLFQERSYALAALNSAGGLAVGLLAAGLGIALGEAL
jgi:CrcB protein